MHEVSKDGHVSARIGVLMCSSKSTEEFPNPRYTDLSTAARDGKDAQTGMPAVVSSTGGSLGDPYWAQSAFPTLPG